MSGSISIIRASVRQGEPRMSEFTFRSVSSPSRSSRILPGQEVTRDRLFNVSVGIFWNRRRGVSVKCSRSRRSHGRPEVRGGSSQRVPIFAEHTRSTRYSMIRERSFTPFSCGGRKSRTVHVMKDARTSSLPSGRKRRCVFFTQRPENYWRTRVAYWRTENTSMTGRTRSGKSRGRRTADAGEFRSTQLEPDDAIDAMAYATSRSAQTTIHQRQPRARLESAAIGVARRKEKRKGEQKEEQGWARSRGWACCAGPPCHKRWGGQEEGTPRVSPRDCNKFLDGNLEHPSTSSEEIEIGNWYRNVII